MAKKAARKRKTLAPKVATPERRPAATGEPMAVSKQTVGGVSGAVVGGMVAGPVGAIIGGVAGALVGDASAKGKKPIKRAAKAVKSGLTRSGKKPAVVKESARAKTPTKTTKKASKKVAGKTATRKKSAKKKKRSV